MWSYPINSVFNAGAVRLPSGETLLLVRVEDRRGFSHLTAARSPDGISGWRIDPKPTFLPAPEDFPTEAWGIEDPRITRLEETDTYAVTYTSYFYGGPCVSLALTRDFRSFDRVGVVAPPENKDAALFPRKFGGRWAMIHRPMGAMAGGKGHMWISFSPDLKYWGEHALLMPARRGPWWDARKIGLCTPPIETPEGWLVFYHGVKETAAGALYRVGAVLLERDQPWRVKLRGTRWLFSPHEPYERVGDVSQVVFPCGCTVQDDGDTIYLYYGAADTTVALATGRISEILDWLRETGKPESPAPME